MNRIARRAAVGMMVAVVMAGFLFWWEDVLRTRGIRASAPDLVATTKAIDPPAARRLADTLLGAIVAAPLDQDLVNRFYTVATVNRLIVPAGLAAWRTQLSRLGWRSTTAQQNLLVAAAYANDLPTILDRTDGMMRRRRLVDQLVVLLYTIEQSPETHDTLVARLEARVPWRTTFFTDPRGVATPAGRQARFDTIRTMLNAGHPISRPEIAPLLVAMTTASDYSRAFAVWHLFRSQGGRTSVLGTGETFDPEFAVYRDAQRMVPVSDLPFEWQTVSGDGYSTDVTGDAVTLHWDGTGVPILLRQTFRAVPGMYELALSGTDATPEFLNRFEAVALCPQGETIFAVIRRGGDGRFALGSTDAVPCAFPMLLVRGRASMVPQPVDVSLTSILLRPLRG